MGKLDFPKSREPGENSKNSKFAKTSKFAKLLERAEKRPQPFGCGLFPP